MKFAIALIAATLATASQAHAACADLPSHDALKKALTAARQDKNGGMNLDMWGVVVDRTGTTCAVAYTGEKVDSQWPGSRMIAAQKANTANAFSLPAYALSTANLYAGTQPGGFLFEIGLSNPVNQAVAYKGDAAAFGSAKDPWVGEKVGGVIVFGGGLALYTEAGALIGAIGVSGDTSCADHNIAWRTRHALNLDFVPNGASKAKDDNVIYDIGLTGKSKSGFGQPKCGGDEAKISEKLPGIQKKK
ncbi:MAG: heme-binding protein [Proteobacteria bacterium]|nr:MAG: heme-binding protein [Pseudomonadota bacterium]